MKKLLLGIALVATLALTAAVGSQAAATHLTTPFSILMTNPCTGDDVTLTGSLDVVVRATTSASGRSNFALHQVTDASGSGVPSGTQYAAHEVDNFEENNVTSANGAFEVTETTNLHLTTKGSDPNLVVHLTEHETVNANGEITAVTLDFASDCRG
jgi:hypothetical protein